MSSLLILLRYLFFFLLLRPTTTLVVKRQPNEPDVDINAVKEKLDDYVRRYEDPDPKDLAQFSGRVPSMKPSSDEARLNFQEIWETASKDSNPYPNTIMVATAYFQTLADKKSFHLLTWDYSNLPGDVLVVMSSHGAWAMSIPVEEGRRIAEIIRKQAQEAGKPPGDYIKMSDVFITQIIKPYISGSNEESLSRFFANVKKAGGRLTRMGMVLQKESKTKQYAITS
ncbi:hypothetical protein N7492_008149 [Penicillium capsulatum]|uniref:Uncharacterized protein n=1 Tax=Penicillium capsulatum TaxID=69766 RepID=A0A9W9HSY7_9EURO|nr:hypothetical protein N7492_008149 [Penicillium capsulatum]KAJ6105560.1 hypothetical protein N7512_009077 [Penicillium capsulatum]